MSLETTRKGISDILDLLKKGEWQIPQFQREFIWTPEQVKKLVNSFIKSYPIGLITTWDQPQGQPHTPGEPLKLQDGSEFKDFIDNPSVIKLVLDGKQRLTTLAMVFGGLHTRDDRFTYSGAWFLNIDAYSGEDEANIVVYKKQKEITKEDLSTLANFIKKGLIPFMDFHKLGEYLTNIYNPAIYPKDEYPEKEVLEKRSASLNELLSNYNKFQIPIAEIPSSVDLGAVCEIFDVLNTTGTKVSTSDLIHNRLFKESNGAFLLRENFNKYSDLNSFGLLCDDDRQEFLCQVVTGCYLLQEKPIKANKQTENVTSIKGKDLIETPLSFYNTFDSNSAKIDSYTSELYSNVFNADFRLKDIPYPVQLILYLSLRWNLEFRLKTEYYNVEELNKVYKAFFWRNTLTNRYDQGFLTQFSTDLKFIDEALKRNIVNRQDKWTEKMNVELDNHFGVQFKSKSKDEILEIVKDGQIKGALAQGINLLISSSAKFDLVTGEKLDRFTDERGKKVQLHHIFPKDWCRNNKGNHQILNVVTENNFSNLIPVTATSNNIWKANSPATALKSNKLDFNFNVQRFEAGFINLTAFDALAKDNVEEFWKLRADKIAEQLHNFQFVN
jgi:hypothetical protein